MDVDALAEWASAGGACRTARRRLEELPDADGRPYRAIVPFVYEDRSLYRDDFTPREINGAISRAPAREVSLFGMRAIQHSVSRARVLLYLAEPDRMPRGSLNHDTGVPVDLPIVVQYRGVRLLFDGHHRATAACVRGDLAMMVRLVDLGTARGIKWTSEMSVGTGLGVPMTHCAT